MTRQQIRTTPETATDGPQGAPQRSDTARDPQTARRRSGARTAPPSTPEQLTLPAGLIAAVLLPVPIPSARRRGRRVVSTPDISDYQPEETR